MSGKTTTTTDDKIADLRVQSSVYGIPIPMLYGVNRLPGNVIWYGGFKAIPHTSTTSSGGKGGGTKTQNTTFTYTASVMMGVCHGDITGIPRIWRGKKLFVGGITSTNIVTVTESYVIPSSGAVFTCANAAAFKAVVSITALIAIGSDAAQDITFAQGVDFSVTAGVFTFLNDAYIGTVASVTYQIGRASCRERVYSSV